MSGVTKESGFLCKVQQLSFCKPALIMIYAQDGALLRQGAAAHPGRRMPPKSVIRSKYTEVPPVVLGKNDKNRPVFIPDAHCSTPPVIATIFLEAALQGAGLAAFRGHPAACGGFELKYGGAK